MTEFPFLGELTLNSSGLTSLVNVKMTEMVILNQRSWA